MTMRELIGYQIDELTFQFEKVLENIQPGKVDHKACSTSMSPRETLLHLCDCYHAIIAHSQGKEYEWGSFKAEDESWSGAQKAFRDLRGKARDAALAIADDEELGKTATGYLVLHDAYHVGQLASVRVDTDPAWDPYSIYRS